MNEAKRKIFITFSIIIVFLLLYSSFSTFLAPVMAIAIPLVSICLALKGRKSLVESKKKTIDSENRLDQLNEEIKEKQMQSELLVCKIAENEAKIKELDDQLESKLNELEDDPIHYLRNQKEQLTEEVQRLSDTFEAKRNEFIALSEKLNELENRVEQKKIELDLLQKKDPEYIEELKESNKSSLDQELDSLRSQIELSYKLLSDLTETTDKISKLKKLYKDGILTEDEFEAKKEIILSKDEKQPSLKNRGKEYL